MGALLFLLMTSWSFAQRTPVGDGSLKKDNPTTGVNSSETIQANNPILIITSPTKNEQVKSPLIVKGNADRNTVIEVNVVVNYTGGSQDLGTFKVNTKSDGSWSTIPINLWMPEGAKNVKFDITASIEQGDTTYTTNVVSVRPPQKTQTISLSEIRKDRYKKMNPNAIYKQKGAKSQKSTKGAKTPRSTKAKVYSERHKKKSKLSIDSPESAQGGDIESNNDASGNNLAAAGTGLDYYMALQAKQLEQQMAGTGVTVEQNPTTGNINLTMPGNITFAFEDATLSSSFKPTLDKLASTLNQYNQTTVNIAGHTDSRGAASYNMDLSRDRAYAVANYLSQRGISSNRINMVAYGESRPVADNNTDYGRQQNRRIELTINSLAAAGTGLDYYMELQAKQLEQQMTGTGVTVEQNPTTGNIVLTMPGNITFAFEDATLSSSFKPTLDKLASTMNQYNQTTVNIAGHTDSRGAASYNLSLSRDRAYAVANYLSQRGVSSNRINVIAYGESRPVADNNTDYGRQQNRRIELTINSPKSLN
ncbi:OmpA family protein [Weeksellaceae bacterium KMM 9713]|uniref:OmpA family protein n=1 Tax=Profundicola chukchiensis TaxID=2961959 RepID=A0A9X4MUV6_9FLAO|nr:OmpA family protein [Profundicola chukchiensis]MDG4945248.1 OmpA family protein [Profundicola chukchiensis]